MSRTGNMRVTREHYAYIRTHSHTKPNLTLDGLNVYVHVCLFYINVQSHIACSLKRYSLTSRVILSIRLTRLKPRGPAGTRDCQALLPVYLILSPMALLHTMLGHKVQAGPKYLKAYGPGRGLIWPCLQRLLSNKQLRSKGGRQKHRGVSTKKHGMLLQSSQQCIRANLSIQLKKTCQGQNKISGLE